MFAIVDKFDEVMPRLQKSKIYGLIGSDLGVVTQSTARILDKHLNFQIETWVLPSILILDKLIFMIDPTYRGGLFKEYRRNHNGLEPDIFSLIFE